MKVTVTGGTGFVGKAIVGLLRERGFQISILGRSPRTGIPPEVELFLWEAERSEPPPNSLAGSDVVIHLTGEPVSRRWTPEIRRRMRSSRVEGTRKLVAAIGKLDRKPSALVAASAVGIYGDRGEEELTEDSPPGEGFLADVCREWEAETSRATEMGIRTVMLRIGVVLGVGGGALDQMLPPFRMFLGGVLGSGRQWMSWIHLADLAGLILHAVEDPQLRGVVNAVAPAPVRNAQFTRTLARTIRRPALFAVPEFGLKLLFGDMAQILLASQRIYPRAAEKAGYRFLYPELGPALKNLLG
mgnify:CR=1 FL=1